MNGKAPYQNDLNIQQSILGDPNAFAALYGQYKDKVFAFAFTLTKSKEIAEEAVQDVFLTLWEKRSQIDPAQSFQAYIRTITYNYVMGYFRKAKRNEELFRQLLHTISQAAHSEAEELAGKELHRIYLKAIDQLPPQKKQAYLLSRDGDLSYEEIAAQMGLSKNTVRNHIAEAIRLIRKYVADHAELHLIALAIGFYHL